MTGVQTCALPIYLENNLVAGAFTPERLVVVQSLASQAAISLENALLYSDLKREMTERTRMESALRAITEDTAALTGMDFFRSLVRNLAKALETRYAFVAELAPTGDRVTTLAFWQGDGFGDDVSYALAGTPCERVLKGEVCHYPEGVQGLFPADRDLGTLAADGYLGVPLPNASGQVVGHLAIIDVKPIRPGPQDLAILRTFATRAGTELERQRGEEALRTAVAELERLRDWLQAENVYLQEEMRTQHGFEEIVGRSAALARVLHQIEQVAPGDTTVLITGETGTGKELVARAIHQLSPRREQPLVTVNCGSISPGLVESELFGHEKGAFTGAVGRKIGRFELASGGTVFLDEIGDLPLDLQVKLLRVLQEGEIERVGGSRTIPVDVRVIAATHKDLEEAVEAGHFRADLYYRLNVFPVRTPALRERPEDIPPLVRYFVMKHAAKLGKRIETVPKQALDTLTAYPWPGNVRELANVLERSVIVSRGTTLELGDWIAPSLAPEPRPRADQIPQELTRKRIIEALEQAGWRVSGPRGAARVLGLKATTLESRMKRLGITRPRPSAHSQQP